MWRPKEGWKNPHRGLESETFIEEAANTLLGNAYEAGANAMLKALFKLAKKSPTGKFFIDSNITDAYARVFPLQEEE